MPLSFIEQYENELRKNAEDKANAKIEIFKKESEDKVKAIKKESEDKVKAIKENSEQFFSEIYANADNLGLSDFQKEILFSTSVKF
ncbi:hypothetical protein [Methanobrevibacter sp.]|uniref:hypothetical protein n=1 Tax=Methanobrevibacter sp. TaxID=66852 RepID=UPI00388D73C9